MAQVMGTVVADAAEAYNATIVNYDDDDDTTDGQRSGCAVVATSRVYDPEGEDIFGEGYFSLQVHVSQLVTVESVWMDLETIQSIVETGFDVVTGGQSQFRNYLHSNPLFQSVISVESRQGFSPPTVETVEPSMETTDGPSALPSSFRPSLAPSMAVSAMPQPSYGDESSISPTISVDSMMPTPVDSSHSPTAGPWALPSSVPSLEMDHSWTDDGKTNEPSTLGGQKLTAAATTAIVAASAACIVFCLCLAMFLWYCHRHVGSKTENQERDDSETNDIPEIVRLGSDQRSWADSSMGEYATSTWRKNTKQSNLVGSVPTLGSFDENSLYTSPHTKPLGEDGNSGIIILPLPTPSSLSSQGPRDEVKHHDERLGFKLMDEQTDRSYIEVRALSPRTSSMTYRARIDESAETKNQTSNSVKRHRARSTTEQNRSTFISDRQPYEELRIIRIDPLDPGRDTFNENDDFTLDPSEIDVWSTVLSCDLEDSEGGLGDLSVDISSKAASPLSARSVAPVNNLGLPAYVGLSLADSIDVDVPEDFEERNGSPLVWVNPVPVVETTNTRSPGGGLEIMAHFLDVHAKNITSSHPSEASTTSKPVPFVAPQRAQNQYVVGQRGLAPNPQGRQTVRPWLHQHFESLSIPAVTPEGNESDSSTEHGRVTNEIYLLRDGISGSRKESNDGKSVLKSENYGTVHNSTLRLDDGRIVDQGANPDTISFDGNKSHLSPTFRTSGWRTTGNGPAQNQALLERKRKITVSAPRGKLGIVLANRYVDIVFDVALSAMSLRTSNCFLLSRIWLETHFLPIFHQTI